MDEKTILENWNHNEDLNDITVREDSHVEEDDKLILKKFRNYRIIKELEAKGAECDSYIIEKDGQKRFLKLYRKGINPKIDLLEKLQKISSELKEHVVEIYEVGKDEDTGRHFEIMEYVEYGTLEDNIEKVRDKIDVVVEELAEAINALHEKGIIHRDLKPSNILIRDFQKLDLVLIDFGISREFSGDISKVYTTFKGTYSYMAPEEISGYFGKEIDWWHLGVIIYEILKGKNPFSGSSEAVIKNTLATQGIEIPEDIDKKYQVLLKGLLTRNYKKRWGYEQVRQWLNNEENIPVFYEEYSTGESSIDEWLEAGFSRESEWIKIGTEIKVGPKEAKTFWEAGFSASEMKEWVEAGFRNGKVAREWNNYGFSSEEAKIFDGFGFSPKNAHILQEKGVTAYDILTLTEKGIDKNKIFDFVERGIFYYILNGFSEEEALKWKGHGFNVDEAKKWIERGFSANEAAEWKEKGIYTDNPLIWKKFGISLKLVKRLRKIGLTANEIEKIFDSAENRKNILKKILKEINLWLMAGFEMSEAVDFIIKGYDLDSAIKYKQKEGKINKNNTYSKSYNWQRNENAIWRLVLGIGKISIFLLVISILTRLLIQFNFIRNSIISNYDSSLFIPLFLLEILIWEIPVLFCIFARYLLKLDIISIFLLSGFTFLMSDTVNGYVGATEKIKVLHIYLTEITNILISFRNFIYKEIGATTEFSFLTALSCIISLVALVVYASGIRWGKSYRIRRNIIIKDQYGLVWMSLGMFKIATFILGILLATNAFKYLYKSRGNNDDTFIAIIFIIIPVLLYVFARYLLKLGLGSIFLLSGLSFSTSAIMYDYSVGVLKKGEISQTFLIKIIDILSQHENFIYGKLWVTEEFAFFAGFLFIISFFALLVKFWLE